MKKKIIASGVLVVLMAVAVALYFIIPAYEPEEFEFVPLHMYDFLPERFTADVVGFAIEREDFEIDFVLNEDEIWETTGVFVNVNQMAINTTVRDFINPIINHRIEIDNLAETAQYGLYPPVSTVSVTFADGGIEVVHVGYRTPDNAFYYVRVEGIDDEVLLMRRAAGSRAYFGYNEFVARGMREMDPSFLFSFQLVREGHEQIWVMPNIMRPIPHGFHRHMAGLVGLIMYEPVEWRDIVPNEFIERVFNPITDIRLERLVDITLDNLADFGLDEPWIEIAFEEVHQGYEEGHAWGIFDNHRWTLIIGNPTDDSHEHFYAVYGGIPHVFTVSARDLNPVLALDYFWIINRFVSIINIWQVYDITIEGRDRSHFFEINTDYARGPAEHHFRPTVDGVNVQDNAFRWFYQLVAGLTFEILTEPHLPQGEPDLVIEFTTDDEWENGPIIRNEFFVYDPNFYSVIQENSARGRQEYSRLLVSRRDIDSLWRYLDRLIAGELDIAR